MKKAKDQLVARWGDDSEVREVFLCSDTNKIKITQHTRGELTEFVYKTSDYRQILEIRDLDGFAKALRCDVSSLVHRLKLDLEFEHFDIADIMDLLGAAGVDFKYCAYGGDECVVENGE